MKTIHVTDRFMILALKESQYILEETGYRRSDLEIQERTEEFRQAVGIALTEL